MKITATLFVIGLLVLSVGACSKSSPTEPVAYTASLYGQVSLPCYIGGTLTIVDSSGNRKTTIPSISSGAFSFETVFVPGPYDAYMDKTGQPQEHLAMHGQNQYSPILHTGSNELYWIGFGGTCK